MELQKVNFRLFTFPFVMLVFLFFGVTTFLFLFGWLLSILIQPRHQELGEHLIQIGHTLLQSSQMNNVIHFPFTIFP